MQQCSLSEAICKDSILSVSVCWRTYMMLANRPIDAAPREISRNQQKKTGPQESRASWGP